MRNVSLSKYLSSLVSKNLSKSIHFITAFVYLFTFLGPSLAVATQVLTYTETTTEQTVTRSSQSNPVVMRLQDTSSTVDQEDYHRFDLKVERDLVTGGISFALRDFLGAHSLTGSVTQDDLRDSPFKALMTEELHTGFSVDVPDVGQIQCDWQGNLKLVGLPNAAPLALNLVTLGTVDVSDVTFKNLSVKAKSAKFVKGIKIQEDSVFDIEELDLANSGFENTKVMHFLSKTRFVSKKKSGAIKAAL